MHNSAALFLLCLPLTAHAEPYDAEAMASLGSELKDVTPGPGVDRAPARAPAWCASVKPDSGYSIGGFLQAIGNVDDPLRAARIACAFPGNEKSVQRAAAAIEQTWMNQSGESDGDAVMSIAARLDDAGFEASKKQLCSALVASEEASDEEALYAKRRRQLFGCGSAHAAWRDTATAWHDQLPGYLDQSATPTDELVRLAYVLDRAKLAFEDPKYGNAQKYLASYGIDSVDFRALSPEAVKTELETAPYKGNVYAKTVVIESLARARMGIAILDDRAGKLAKDPDWKEILIDAPKRGVDAYVAAAKPYQAEIARSNAFEQALATGSPKRVAGCEATARADFMTVFAKLPHATAEQATTSLADPIASLLFQRLVECVEVAGTPNEAAVLGMLQRDVRYSRGPRTAAYYAQIESLAKIHADRPRFPFSLDRAAFDFLPISHHTAGKTIRDQVDARQGVVKSATKTQDTVHVVFVAKKIRAMTHACVNTDRLLQIRSDGTLQWEQRCHETGMVTVDLTPSPVDVPALYGSGIAAGHFVDLATGGIPRVVYADATKAKLLNFYSFGL